VTTGRFITLEGGEGAGKSTQIQRLIAWLTKEQGHQVIATREPGGSDGAEAIRELLVNGEVDRWDAETEALLHFAARRDHVERRVRPALEAGIWVVCDRFADSTRAYQGIVQCAGLDYIEELYRLTLGGLAPDLTLILDLPVELGLERARERGGSDRYERMGLAFHEALREAFLVIAAKHADRCAIVDATGSVDEIAARLRHVVSTRWP
tara:strand:- start:6814 stop:7440 length:627 start_codon:yes stop_codon:yes gene_type:complete